MKQTEKSINPAEENQPTKTDMIPLEDDELDTVAGGASRDEQEAKAKADGRIVNLPINNFLLGLGSGHLCICHHKNKWAKSVEIRYVPTFHRYVDVKCYKCGKEWDHYDDYPNGGRPIGGS